ncbi:hypothetical protein [Actinomadura rubrisoli]|uniref:Ferritin-like domain-containing protein n=1 Tax=Actinomadura rubrisoli TaxID=2530368 RepID=A0A4R5CGR3_9ACTN|nr:hypothetical protein [Actinomadura rubrisoli]TDD96464.1 hypothetical protein E1298_03220 [Actinomadura rubrisoli]
MAFNPLEHRGIPLDDQLRDWSPPGVPVDPDDLDPYTRCRIITLNGIEVEAVMFSHHLAGTCPDAKVQERLRHVRHIEQRQQKTLNWLLPGQASVLETTIAYEQVAVDLTGWVARMEPDPRLKRAYEFGLLEDFDHLYRYADLYEAIEHRGAERIVDQVTEVTPGRLDHLCRGTAGTARRRWEREATVPLSRLHALTIMSAERQTMNFYMNVGPMYMEPIARQLYQEIGLVEVEHVTHYESLVDPGETWWERLVHHEYNECYLYYAFMQTESDPRVKAIWETHLGMELEHLRLACDLMRRHDGRDPESVLPSALPEPVAFEPNKRLVRELLATQIDYTTLGTGHVHEAHRRFEKMQQKANAEHPARPVGASRGWSGRQ